MTVQLFKLAKHSMQSCLPLLFSVICPSHLLSGMQKELCGQYSKTFLNTDYEEVY